jgi:GNAT superfamily N-acetyltransferase
MVAPAAPPPHLNPMRPGLRIEAPGPEDAGAIADIHVEVWRAAYAGILPDRVLLRLSRPRLAAQYAHAIGRGDGGVLVARDVSGVVAGFTTFAAGPAPLPGSADPRWGEVETLYVHEDHRDRGLGRALLAAAAAALEEAGCGALFLQVLADNHSRWFYQHLGGRPQGRSTTYVGGTPMAQIAMAWNPIGPLVRKG